MHFVVLIPVWLAVVIWFVKTFHAGSSKSVMVQRVIKAPDGQVAIFTVPANEPYAVSIGRMYPDGIPEGPPLIEAAKAIEAHTDWRSVPYKLPERQDAKKLNAYVALGIFATFVVFALAFGKLTNGSEEPVATGYSPYQAQSGYEPYRAPLVPRAEAKPSLNAVRANSAVMERVRLKTGANIRNAGSRNGAILRAANQGDILMKFSEVNGWLQVGPVGATVPEGWVALSTVGPITP